MTMFFTGDSHFFHTNIIKSCNRPFHNADEMNNEIIKRWNDVVSEHDIVFHIGDVACGRDKHKSIDLVRQLKGKKILLLGNHDRSLEQEFKKVFYRVTPYLELPYEIENYGKIKICLFHYPIDSWNKWHFSSIHLHGHSHGKMPKRTNRFDIGVDSHNFTPISIDEILKQWKINEPYKP